MASNWVQRKAHVLLICFYFLSSSADDALGQKAASPVANQIRAAILAEFAPLHPLDAENRATSYLLGFVQSPLVFQNQDHQWQSYFVEQIPAADSLEVKIHGENAERRMSVSFQLKKNLFWGDGTPLTVADIQFTWELARSGVLPPTALETYFAIESIVGDPLQPLRFTINYHTVDSDFISGLAHFYILPKHLEQTPFETFGKTPGAYQANSHYLKNPLSKGLYNGPYVVESLQPGVEMVLKPNLYFNPQASQSLKIIVNPNLFDLTQRLVAHELDLVLPYELTLEVINHFKQVIADKKLPFDIKRAPSSVLEQITFQMRHPHLGHLQFRKILMYAIDRQHLVDSLFDGEFYPAECYVSQQQPHASFLKDGLTPYSFSIPESVRLLELLGYQLRKDGFRYKGKDRFEVTLVTNAHHPYRQAIQEYLKESWKNVGIATQLVTEDSQSFFQTTLRKSQFTDLALFAWDLERDRNPCEWFHSRSIPVKANGFVGKNVGAWQNEEVKSICDQLASSIEPSKHQKLAKSLLTLYTQELPMIPLFFRSQFAIVSQNLTGFVLTADGPLDSHLWKIGEK